MGVAASGTRTPGQKSMVFFIYHYVLVLTSWTLLKQLVDQYADGVFPQISGWTLVCSQTREQKSNKARAGRARKTITKIHGSGKTDRHSKDAIAGRWLGR